MDDKYKNPMQFLANLLGDAGLLSTPSKVSPCLPGLDETQRRAYDEYCLHFMTPANLRHYTAWQLIEAAFAAGVWQGELHNAGSKFDFEAYAEHLKPNGGGGNY